MIDGTDITPTILQAAGVPTPDNLDGTSFLQVLQNREPIERKQIYTYFLSTSNKLKYPMRAVQDRKYGYIFNAWSDGKTVFQNEPTQGRTMKAMLLASKSDADIARRTFFFLFRTPEEFYDYEADPDALHNLIDDPEYKDKVQHYRNFLLNHMADTNDPLLDVYCTRLSKDSDNSVKDIQKCGLSSVSHNHSSTKPTPSA